MHRDFSKPKKNPSNKAANHSRFGARGTERTLLWALCCWNKGKPATRSAQSLSTPSDCLGQKYGICFAQKVEKHLKVDFTDQLVDWSETCCGLKEIEDPLGCFHISTEDISPKENSEEKKKKL